jgi:hypothetical protein
MTWRSAFAGLVVLAAFAGTSAAAPPKRKKPKPAPVIVDAGAPPPEDSIPTSPEMDEAGAPPAEPKPAEPTPPEAVTPSSSPPPEEPEPDKPTFQLGGRIFGYARAPLLSLTTNPFQQVSSSVWLEGKATFNKNTSALAVLQADALTPSLDNTYELRARIREAWASAHGSGLEFRVGQQIISWGNADGVNVLDVLTATDFRFFSADTEVRKIGALSTYFSWVPGKDGPVEIALVWTPVAPQSTLLFPPSIIPAGVTLAEPVRPKPSLGNSEVAAKITLTGTGWDIAAVGFYGFNHLPEFYLARQDPTTGITIGRTNYHYLVTGGEASYSSGKWVFRFEGGYTFTESNRGAIAFIQPSYLGAIAGLERPLGERFRLNAQGLVRYYPFFKNPTAQAGDSPALQGIAQANAIVQNYTDQARPGATLRLAYLSEGESVEAEIFGLYYFIGNDYVVRPLVGYRFSEAFKLQLGAEYFGGKETKSIGSLHRFSGVFLQATFLF